MHFTLSRYVVLCLEAICYNFHQELLSSDFITWPASTKSEALNLLQSITAYDFLETFAILYTLLNPLSGITQKLQAKALDIHQAHVYVSATSIQISCFIMVCTVVHLKQCMHLKHNVFLYSFH